MGSLLAGCAVHRFTGRLDGGISKSRDKNQDMWRELTEADVMGVMSEPEALAYQSAATGIGQDVLADVLGQVVNHCRGYIADNTQNQLAEGLTRMALT